MKEWFERLDRGDTFSEIADWLNSQGVPTGPFCRSERWTCAMVGRITRNPILKGVRERNRKESKRFNKTGKHKSVNAKPEDLLERICPHLAFFEAAYYDRVLAKVKARNAKYRRTARTGAEPVANRPKKRMRYPGQSIRCGVCGRPFVFGAHGQYGSPDVLRGSRVPLLEWDFPGRSVDRPAGCRDGAGGNRGAGGFRRRVHASGERRGPKARCPTGPPSSRAGDADRSASREIQNVLKFIRGGCESPSVAEDLQQLEAELPQLQAEKAEIERTPSQVVVIPPRPKSGSWPGNPSGSLALESYEFAKLMRSLVTDFFVFPYRSCDGKDLVLRGTARLQLANLLPDQRLQDTLRAPLERVLNLDLFEPPQRVKCREQVMALRREMTEREAAERLGITETAAQYAAGLDRLMRRLGLTDPYVRMLEPPTDYPKMRRHLHPRYRFDPLPGFGTE